MNSKKSITEKDGSLTGLEKKAEAPPVQYDESKVDINAFHEKYNANLKEDEETKKIQAEHLQQFMDNTGLGMAFKVICAEAMAKNLSPEDVLLYTAGRLRELGKEVDKARAKEHK